MLGKPPIMVAGMTPCTVGANLVSATLDAGYHIELAGGGHYNAAALRAKVAEIQSRVKPGVGITLNALYINQRQFGFQFPLWQEMRRPTHRGILCCCWNPQFREGHGDHYRSQRCGYQTYLIQAGFRRGYPTGSQHRRCQPRLPDHFTVDWWSCRWSPQL
jgi:hypothetical protein